MKDEKDKNYKRNEMREKFVILILLCYLRVIKKKKKRKRMGGLTERVFNDSTKKKEIKRIKRKMNATTLPLITLKSIRRS